MCVCACVCGRESVCVCVRMHVQEKEHTGCEEAMGISIIYRALFAPL